MVSNVSGSHGLIFLRAGEGDLREPNENNYKLVFYKLVNKLPCFDKNSLSLTKQPRLFPQACKNTCSFTYTVSHDCLQKMGLETDLDVGFESLESVEDVVADAAVVLLLLKIVPKFVQAKQKETFLLNHQVPLDEVHPDPQQSWKQTKTCQVTATRWRQKPKRSKGIHDDLPCGSRNDLIRLQVLDVKLDPGRPELLLALKLE